MSVEPTIWANVRAGRGPTEESVAALAGAQAARLGSVGVRRHRDELRAGLLGLGPLADLVRGEQVTDVAVNGDGSVWVDQGAGMERSAVTVPSREEVRRLAVRLAGLAGRRLDESCPYVDGLLPDGIRLHAVLPPLVEDGPHITLRVPARQSPSLTELSRQGTFVEQWVGMLRAMVLRRVPFLVCGGTGAGKTTVLGALLGAGPAADRVVVVEDVAELQVARPHVVRLQARPANVEGRGEVSMSVLVRQALRMRPDRLVVGEVRGPEVRELLTAMNTGHEGGCGTVHANAPEDVVSRVESLGALAGMSRPAVHAQLTSAVEVVLHMRREGQHRVLDSWGVLVRDDPPRVVRALDRSSVGPAWPALARLLGSGSFEPGTT